MCCMARFLEKLTNYRKNHKGVGFYTICSCGKKISCLHQKIKKKKKVFCLQQRINKYPN